MLHLAAYHGRQGVVAMLLAAERSCGRKVAGHVKQI